MGLFDRLRGDKPVPNSLWKRLGWNDLKRSKNNWLDSKVPNGVQDGFEKLEVGLDRLPAKANTRLFGKI